MMSNLFGSPADVEDEEHFDTGDALLPTRSTGAVNTNHSPSTIVSTAVKPRVGGVIAGTTDVWVGGSNITPQLEPVHLGQHRPSKYASALAVQTKNETGIAYKLGRTEADSDVQLTLWIEMIALDIEEKGLDTLILVPNPSWTEEINIVKNYGVAKLTLLKPWIRQLTTTGVRDANHVVSPVCTQDLKNLRYLAKLLLDSLKPKFKSDVLQSTGVAADGITVFALLSRSVFS